MTKPKDSEDHMIARRIRGIGAQRFALDGVEAPRAPREPFDLRPRIDRNATPTMKRAELWKRWRKGLAPGASERFSGTTEVFNSLATRAQIFRLPSRFYQPGAVNVPRAEWLDFINDGGREGSSIDRALSMWETFVLPFPVVALELPFEAILILSKLTLPEDEPSRLVDMMKGTPPPGMAGGYAAVLMVPGHAESMPLNIEPGTEAMHAMITCGAVYVSPEPLIGADGKSLDFDVRLFESVGLLRSGRLGMIWTTGEAYQRANPSHREVGENMLAALGSAISVGFDFFVRVQEPRRVLIELAPENPIKRKRKAKSRASGKGEGLGSKPVFMSLAPREIPGELGIKPPSGATRNFYGRRAHLRRLSSEFYTWKRGQTIAVKAIPPKQATGKTPGGREYRIRTDVASPHVRGDDDQRD